MTQAIARSSRRQLLIASSAALSTALIGRAARADADNAFVHSPWRKLTDSDWRHRLPGPSYDVLRREGTEFPFSSPLTGEHRRGMFVCFGCGLPLFKSVWKYDSGTGWPSFYDVIASNIGRKADHKLVAERTEYHCAQCLGHQGHVFPDGPPPTGLRYCNDGVALRFVAS